MKIRITGKSLPKAETGKQVGDPDDAWIRKILEYEARKGSATGGGLSNFGYNDWQKLGHSRPPRSLDEAVEYYKKDFLPKVQKYPMGLRERMGDYIFNTGRNPNDLLLYNAGKITLDQLNSPNTFTNEWNQFGPEIEKQYSNPDFINSLDTNKQNVYKTTGTYFDPSDPTKKVRYSLSNPNPTFTASWEGRTNMWGKYQAPTQQAASKQVNPGSKTTYTLNGRTLDINNPADAAIIKQKEDELASDQAAINNYYAQKSNSSKGANQTGQPLQLANTLTKLPDQQLMMSTVKLPSNTTMPNIGIPNLQPGLNQLKQTGNKVINKIGQFGNNASSFFANTANSFFKNLQNQPQSSKPASAVQQTPQISGPNLGNQPTFTPTSNQSNPYTWMPSGQGLASQPIQNSAINQQPPSVDLTGFVPPVVANYTEEPIVAPIDPQEEAAKKAKAAFNAKYPNAPVNQTTWQGLDDMVAQRADPFGYEMDQRIKNDPRYARRLKRSLNGKIDTYKTIGAASGALTGAITTAAALTDFIDNKNKQKEFNAYMRDQQMSDNLYPIRQGSRGDYVQSGTSYGAFRPDQMTVNRGMFAEMGGQLNTQNMKIRIISGPSRMEYGGQAKNGYGLDLGSGHIYDQMNEDPRASISNTMSEIENPNEPYVLETEGGEEVLRPDGTKFRLVGNSHANGGIKNTASQVPNGSFIYSKKLKETDPEILAKFGKTYKRGGVSYSDISKQYDLNKFKSILDNPNVDPLAKATAQMMTDNYKKKLGQLALAQEAKKGFKDGIPQAYTNSVAQAAYGGYIPQYQTQGEVKKDDVIYTPEFQKILAGLKNDQKYNMIYSPRILAGDNMVPLMQNRQEATGLYGDITPNEIEEFKKRHEWYFKNKSKWNPASKKDVKDFQKKYEEEFAKEKGYSYFTEKRKFDEIDSKLGEYTYNAPALNKGDDEIVVEKPKYKCQVDASGKTIAVTSTDGTGYNTEAEALANCPTKEEVKPRYICLPDGSIVETKGSGIGYATREEAAKNCGGGKQKRVPFDFLAPDKLSMIAAGMNAPKKYLPYYANYNAVVPSPTFYSPERELAANAEQANIMTQGLANFAGPQSFMSNASAVQGKAAEQAANTLGKYNNLNVGVANQFSPLVAETLNKQAMYAAERANELFKGNVIANQQYDNAKRAYVNNLAKSYANAWNNRMNLGDINDSMAYYYKDPRTGRNVFKGAAGGLGSLGMYGSSNGSVGDQSSVGGLGTAYNSLYKNYLEQLKDSDMTAEERKKEARALAGLGLRSMQQTRTTNSRTPFLFNQRSTRFTGMDPNLLDDDE
jgi:hypothetical protein